MDSSSKTYKHRISKGFVVVVILCIVAYLCRYIEVFGWEGAHNTALVRNAIRDLIYIGIPLGWIASVRRRVIQVQVRRYLTCIALLIVLWILLRTLRYRFVTGFEAQSILWYLYYLPILFIPTMALFAFVSMGKPEGFRLSRRFHLILIPPTILLILTLTNNLTQWAFVFLTDPPSTNNLLYHRAVVFYADAAWAGAMAVICMIVLFSKSRLLTLRQSVAIVALFAGMAVYLIAYTIPAAWEQFIDRYMRDITIVVCLFILAILELCLRFRLIQNNTNYSELFASIDTPTAIMDSEGSVCYVSRQAPDATEAQMQQSQSGSLELPGGILLESMPIRGGAVVWAEDISQIRDMQAEIIALSEQLSEENEMLRAEVELKEKMAVTETRNKLYDDMVGELSLEIEILNTLAKNRGATPEERTAALRRMCMIGAYVKRRSNLLFLAAEHRAVPAEELYYCLQESADALKLVGVDCRIRFGAAGYFDANKIKQAYESFERKIEDSPSMPPVIEVIVVSNGDSIQLEVSAGEDAL